MPPRTPDEPEPRYLLPAPNPGPSELAVRSDGKVWIATVFGIVYLFDAAADDALGALYGHPNARPVWPQSHKVRLRCVAIAVRGEAR